MDTPLTISDDLRLAPSEMPTAEDWARLEAVNTIQSLCALYGYARVGRWVKNLAAIHGEEAK
jgi:hypothetical protein